MENARGSQNFNLGALTASSGITQIKGHYVAHGHSRSPILVPIESSYTTSY